MKIHIDYQIYVKWKGFSRYNGSYSMTLLKPNDAASLTDPGNWSHLVAPVMVFGQVILKSVLERP